MLHPDDRESIAARFGADDAQITRDHLISHLLARLPDTGVATDDLVFFGGTALARTFLPSGRLSEDVDFYATTDRRPIADCLTQAWPRAVRREFPRLQWGKSLSEVRDVDPALIVAEDGAAVRVQLLAVDATYLRWPTEIREIDVRYRDVAPVRLRVPTLDAFAAMKASAWRDRHAARDLFDLAALAEIGAVDARTVALLVDVTGVPLVPEDLVRIPSGAVWREQLGHQCRLELDPQAAMRRFQEAWKAAASW
jgi:predicted nucleotidyltransferase component of viral defense system